MSALMWLSDPDCEQPEIVDEWPNFFSDHDRFDPLEDKFRDAVTDGERKEVMNEVRTLASRILKDDFSHIRKPAQEINSNDQGIGKKEAEKENRMQKKTPPPKITTPPKKQNTPPSKKGGMKM